MRSEWVENYNGFPPKDIQHEAIHNVGKLTEVLGGECFDNITQDEVNNLIDAHSEIPRDENLLELTEYTEEEEEEAPDPGE